MVEVKPITAEDTYAIRHSVLRPHQTIEDCKYDQDSVKGAFHLGGFYDGTLISIASFYPQNQQVYRQRLPTSCAAWRRLRNTGRKKREAR